MFRRIHKTAREDAPRLILDLLIVIFGVSISFAVQDWRSGQNDRAEERRVLDNFASELRADSEELERICKRVEAGIESLRMVATSKGDEAIRAHDTAMDNALGYTVFSPSASTYAEIQQTGASRFIRDKSLLRDLISLYERGYRTVEEWDQISRKFVLDRMFPFVDEHGPAFEVKTEGSVAVGYGAAFRALKSDTRFRNLLRSAILFKQSQLAVYQGARAQLAKLLDRLPASQK